MSRSPKQSVGFKIDQTSRLSLVEQVTDGLREAILNGKFKAGEPLPSRDEIARELGVSTRVTREALARLTKEQLVNPRKHIGSIVLPHGSTIWHGCVYLVCSEWNELDFWAMTIIGSIRRRLISAGYLFLVVTVPYKDNGQPDISVLDAAFARKCDLAILLNTPREINERIGRKGIRTISAFCKNKSSSPGGIASIDTSPISVAETFVTQCRQLGIKSVLQTGFSGTAIDLTGKLAEAGIKTEVAFEKISGKSSRPDTLESQIRKAMEFTLRRFSPPKPKRPDLIFFTDDFFAKGAVVALSTLGIRIPEDIKAVTVSNKGFAPVYPKRFTVIEYDFNAYGDITADLALSVLAGKFTPSHIVVSPLYIPGETF